MLSLLGGIFLGWSLGANDASNVFGSAVAAKMIRFWTAAVLASVFVLLGALLEGEAGIETLKDLTPLNLEQAVILSVAAAATVTIMTVFSLPVSTSQAVVGAILGIGLLNQDINTPGLGKVVACWFGTPLGGMIISVILYRLMAFFYNRLNINMFQSDSLLRISLIVAGSYGAYALGANNVANVTAVFVAAGKLTVFSAVLLGGLSIGLGILTFSRRVMETVGRRLVRLDPFSALIVVLAEAITVHFYTLLGVPVSTSQAVVGAVLGVGIVKGISTVRKRTLINILFGWFLTPMVAIIIAVCIYFAVHLYYIPPG
ncbi:MAG: anion permease [Desulfobacteraceae bacterium]|nr:inorganic phosphate transporter [Desulfobacterales bacterium]MBL6966821.1 anion permease [Desulfobacteraceae bacterium]MBL7101886.1 anion permease [Desulfobacteraceae bacterium]MBL7172237.1 anion permease [Desulfobacteraceae bacterium]MBU0990369.1 inorganic phosphate transporter family protein [Pseudomonadota bacterium]